MKINFRTVPFLVGVFMIVSGPCAFAHTDVTAEQARELIDSTDDLIVIDVREPSEYSDTRGHIPGALNYPFYSGVLQTRYEELPTDGPILVVCGSGSRSNRAAKFLDSMGFSTVYDMLGGMSAWIWETETSAGASTKYSGGTGEPNDPYQIATAEDLITLGETPEDYDKHFILTDDIDLDPNLPGRKVFDKAVIAPDINDSEGWLQGTFTGVFDGDGHTISHLTIVGDSVLGLFGHLYGDNLSVKVKNLGIVDVNVIGSGYTIGSLAGENLFCRISNSYSTGTVSGYATVGGLVGANGQLIFGGAITGSYSSCSVSGNDLVGGLVGNNSGTISDCYSRGSVSGGTNGSVGGLSVGGLVGHQNDSGSITTCYSSGSVSGPDEWVGGLVGGSYGYTNQCFWDTETSGQATSFGGTGKTTAEMQTASTFLDAGWDFVGEKENGTGDIWSICEGTNYPRFVWQIPIGDFVCPDGVTIEDFAFFMEHWLYGNCDSSNDYCEGTDLDRSGTVDVLDLEIFFENWPAE